MVRAAAEGAEKEEENEESLVLFLSVWLMTGCACVSYTDKRREKRGGRVRKQLLMFFSWIGFIVLGSIARP